jgi:beta-xylosidase
MIRAVFVLFFFYCCLASFGQPYVSQVWSPDLGNGYYRNPVIFADYSDPDVCRVGDDYYMTASSFGCVPGLPVLHSKDLVNWRIIGYALQELSPAEVFDLPQHGNGVYAPCIRYHGGAFYIYWGDPDFGIYMVKTEDPAGKWDEPVLVKAGKGMIDPSPLFDEDGKAYLVHAWAGSRIRINSILSVCEMNTEGTKVTGSEVLVFDGLAGGNHTVEGAKFYKRNGYYYILAPAGGVKNGWQLALRSRQVFGPYEKKVVLEQGSTPINGPHQGGWVETSSGESWFLHFQDREAYGRIVHLQPVEWRNEWPEMGVAKNGKREPVLSAQKPQTPVAYPFENPVESDEFDQAKIGLQWQWNANPKDPWAMASNAGFLRLYAIPLPSAYSNFWDVPNLLLQKFPAEEFSATTKLTFSSTAGNEKTGLIVMGLDYSYISLSKTATGYKISQTVCRDADKKTPERIVAETAFEESSVYLRVSVGKQAVCRFSYSTDGKNFLLLGESFKARQGKWIGAKVGLFAANDSERGNLGYADFDWFRIEKPTPRPPKGGGLMP